MTDLPALEIDACRDLARAVIKRATQDRHSIDDYEYRTAYLFVFDPEYTEIRELWCTLAGIRPEQLQARWLRAEEYDRLMKRRRGQAA